MVFLAAALPLVLAASSAFARALPTRRASPACDGLSDEAYDTLASFTLASYTIGSPNINANATGQPLVLGQAGAIDGAEFFVFSTWASYPYNDYPTLSLTNGALTAISDSGHVIPSGGASSNGEPGFILTTPEPDPAEVYCIVPPFEPSGYPLLAINGYTDYFSLCQLNGGDDPQQNVVYNVSTAEPLYSELYDWCKSIIIHVVPSS